MTVDEFINEYSWEQAREWHAEMMAQNTRRSKRYSRTQPWKINQ